MKKNLKIILGSRTRLEETEPVPYNLDEKFKPEVELRKDFFSTSGEAIDMVDHVGPHGREKHRRSSRRLGGTATAATAITSIGPASAVHRPLREAAESGPRTATEFCFDSYYILFHLSF